MQNSKQKREPAWRDLGLWARHAAFNASQGTGKRIAGWIVLAVYAAFVFGLPPLIWFTWHEWDFCRVAHIFSCIMPLYWIYLAVKARQRHEDGEPLLEPSDEEIASASEGFRAWRIRLYERPARAKMVDIAFRLTVLGVLALIFRARIGGNGYFWLLCAELAFRALLMIKRPARFARPTVIEPA
ncbi:hypothetical protein [Granulicella mallensis]|uniref:Transmembrane protein n=1 Tax=Granulicella mallensis TaxID=940614 RepID=A0A7W7ZSH7_9BACT|nr:hypothetical protein [Granulicella mallensis]MBB5064978.1 hypothetical protein [Granulicella mallensis]